MKTRILLLMLALLAFILLACPASVTAQDEERWISIPSIDLSEGVAEVPYDGVQWDTTELGTEVGHLEYTDWLNGGNTILIGHLTLDNPTPGDPGGFYRLPEVEVGDTIWLYEGAAAYEFEVVSTDIVDETATEILNSTQTQVLTLFTCFNWDSKLGRYVDRFVVIAVPVIG